MEELLSELNQVPNSCRNLTINHIFADNHNWELYRCTHRIRKVEEKEVQKMLTCQEESRGYFIYQCPNCYEEKTIHFGCNFRMCSYCGKHYTDKWAERLANQMLDVPHRHIVMTIPDKFRFLFEGNWKLLKLLMDCAIRVISQVLKWCLGKEMKPGVIVVLHTYGRDLKFNSHLHLLVTEGGFRQNGEWVQKSLFPYKMLRKAWQYQLLTSLKKSIENNAKNKKLIDSLFKRYPNGFYVYAKDTVKGKKRVACYIGRHIRHPAIANSRISSYDGKQVTFWW